MYAIHKRNVIIDKLTNLGAKSPTEEALSKFNNEPLQVLNDSLMINGADSTVTILFLGNSLTYTGVPDEEQNKTKRGLTSTEPSKDYVHQLVSHISEGNRVNVKYSVTNIAEFERTFTAHPFSMNKLKNALCKKPTFLIVQIGENVSEEDIKNPAKFENEYQSLLKLFPNSKLIVTLPFWPSKQKQYAVTNIAIKSKSYLVDISHLDDGTDSQNFASSHRKYSKPGVGEHPGDVGMRHIADCYYATINAILSDN